MIGETMGSGISMLVNASEAQHFALQISLGKEYLSFLVETTSSSNRARSSPRGPSVPDRQELA